ncbi:hypothetical protein E2C01_030338 [Portunus trituberculatus]|uniref:Uncharacterized protein n=1 Tax=Portunus trituberculatus TaxID=210409 RepID=A0A5B7EV30_PORTR|nr:hypothetical protein [Portunus trituberculatus]
MASGGDSNDTPTNTTRSHCTHWIFLLTHSLTPLTAWRQRNTPKHTACPRGAQRKGAEHRHQLSHGGQREREEEREKERDRDRDETERAVPGQVSGRRHRSKALSPRDSRSRVRGIVCRPVWPVKLYHHKTLGSSAAHLPTPLCLYAAALTSALAVRRLSLRHSRHYKDSKITTRVASEKKLQEKKRVSRTQCHLSPWPLSGTPPQPSQPPTPRRALSSTYPPRIIPNNVLYRIFNTKMDVKGEVYPTRH